MRNREMIVELCHAANEPRGPGFLGSRRHQRDVEGKFIQLLISFSIRPYTVSRVSTGFLVNEWWRVDFLWKALKRK
jgi:hypothetical protein